jgi:hypothetical protein
MIKGENVGLIMSAMMSAISIVGLVPFVGGP